MSDALHAERETGLADDVQPGPTRGTVAASGEVTLERVPAPDEDEDEDEEEQ